MQDMPEKEKAPKRLRRFFVMFWLVTLFLLGGTLYVVSNSENNGEVVNNSAERLALDVPTTTTETIDTPYYSLEYSSEFEYQKNPDKTPDLLDLQVLLSHSEKDNPGSIRVSLGIERLPVGGVPEMSPYKLAEGFPEKYTIEKRAHDEGECYVITKYDDRSNKIVLLPHNENVLVMALASQTIGDMPKYDSFIDQAVESLQWK